MWDSWLRLYNVGGGVAQTVGLELEVRDRAATEQWLRCAGAGGAREAEVRGAERCGVDGGGGHFPPRMVLVQLLLLPLLLLLLLLSATATARPLRLPRARPRVALARTTRAMAPSSPSAALAIESLSTVPSAAKDSANCRAAVVESGTSRTSTSRRLLAERSATARHSDCTSLCAGGATYGLGEGWEGAGARARGVRSRHRRLRLAHQHDAGEREARLAVRESCGDQWLRLDARVRASSCISRGHRGRLSRRGARFKSSLVKNVLKTV